MAVARDADCPRAARRFKSTRHGLFVAAGMPTLRAGMLIININKITYHIVSASFVGILFRHRGSLVVRGNTPSLRSSHVPIRLSIDMFRANICHMKTRKAVTLAAPDQS